MIIIDDHLKIKNAHMLKDYLVKRLSKKYGFNPFEITHCDDNHFRGYVHNISFGVYFDVGKTCTIVVEEGWEGVLDELQNTIAPVMWKIDEKAENPDRYAIPLIRYKLPMGVSAVEWDNFNPMQKLLMYARPCFDSTIEPTDIDILYPITMGELKSKLKYGEYKYAFEKEAREVVDSFSQEEIYAHIKAFNNQLNEVLSHDELTAEDYYNIDSMRFCANYLMQLTKKYGIKVNEPSLKPVTPTPEFISWYLTIDKIYKLTSKNENVDFDELEKNNFEEYQELALYFENKQKWMEENIKSHLDEARMIIKNAEGKGYSDVLNIFFISSEPSDDLKI